VLQVQAVGTHKADCPTWDKKDSQSLESSTLLAGNSEHPGDILTIFREDTYSQDDWVLDLGATNHICSRGNFLRRFKNQKKVLSLCLTGPSVTPWG